MTTYSEHEQRQLDQTSGAALDRIQGQFFGKRFVEAIDDLKTLTAACERRSCDKHRPDMGDWDDAAARLRLIARKLLGDDVYYADKEDGAA